MPSNCHPVWPNPILRVRLCPCLLQASNKEEQYGEQVRILGAKHKEVRTQHYIDITENTLFDTHLFETLILSGFTD